jgi:ElaB/YqjD/DUF883 family membrane-anchored ribosome-binding protein
VSDPAEQVVVLRDRVQRQEQELEAAVLELAAAARRFGAAEWIRESQWIRAHPWTSLLGATGLGLLVARLSRGGR